MRKPRLRDIDGTEYDPETGARNNLSVPMYFAAFRAETAALWYKEINKAWWHDWNDARLVEAMKGTK